MEKKKHRFLTIHSVILGFLITTSVSCQQYSINPSKRETKSRCYPPFNDFSEEDLVGTWEAGTPNHIDTLIIRGDGTYRQTIQVELAEDNSIDYESEWKTWYLEYSLDGIPHLHLSGFSFCGMNTDIPCEKKDGGGYDFCKEEYMSMDGEGILIILGIKNLDELPSSAVGQKYIDLFYSLGFAHSWVYQYQGP